MKVWFDSEGLGALLHPRSQRQAFSSEEQTAVAQAEREGKAMLWFSVSEGIRKRYLLQLARRDASCYEVFAKIRKEVRPWRWDFWDIFWTFILFLFTLGFVIAAIEEGKISWAVVVFILFMLFIGWTIISETLQLLSEVWPANSEIVPTLTKVIMKTNRRGLPRAMS